MREVEIYFEGLDAATVDGDHWLRAPLDMPTMRILSGLRELTSLWLDVTLGSALTDGDYAELTRWWPHLLGFDVSTISMLRLSEGQEQTPATLHTLVHFADNCPHLERLSVPLSTDLDLDEGPHINRKMYGRRTRKHPLVSLDVGDSPLEPGSENDIVLLLCSLFPGLRDPDFSILRFEGDEPWSAGWQGVESRLNLLRQMARYEDIERRLEDGTLVLDDN
ncbi:uncharacterized protein SCHCODRAFT_02486319 [Schizophyllum commune H4-8]|uniref:F-box domain-containing protein n=1 Tax=Schizophyllum commune (strain H4-8 / FGSC 9210) TaxID=578458 RepID=D8PMH8_SCHCM|nr:uncharacterized protein SCHCODRAFT_02486319 [Schizophyllum commune H4-8]KAI5898808.1 hypothetical protein SCHCODRAFT_02486319 [Schizophyllum commune H4-8]